MLVVADFDNYFYVTRAPDIVSAMITNPDKAKVFVWETTTSSLAEAQIPENELAEEYVLFEDEATQRP